jgi:lipopolysaccharide biosynthesis regulator YciM
MFDPLWLILPAVFVTGWLWVRRRPRSAGSGYRRNNFTSDYFKGLNYVLHEQPDKAIEVFIRMVEVDSETVETHLALGNLFRRRGEVDRAIRIHQNLIARPTLNREQRTLALLELGEDYMRAGLFDRAENLFLELIELGSHAVPALRNLADIYQQEKDWEKAINMERRLAVETGRNRNDIIAQYLCELAEEAQSRGDHERTWKMLRKALATDRNCVRASLLQGHLFSASGDREGAIRAYRRVAEQDIDYLPEVIGPLRKCYELQQQSAVMMSYLESMLDRYKGVAPMLALADMIQRQQGDQAASEFLASRLRANPSVRGLERLVQLKMANLQDCARESMEDLRSVTVRLVEDKPLYRCKHCGFTGKSLHWQCPGCKTWGSVKPMKGIDGE